MDPITLGALVSGFLTAAVSAMGSAAGTRVFEAIFPKVGSAVGPQAVAAYSEGPSRPTSDDELRLRSALTQQMQQSPGMIRTVTDALNQDLRANPRQAAAAMAVVERADRSLLERVLDISSEQARAQRGKCPVGGEFMFRPPTYFKGDGSPMPGAPFITFGRMKRESMSAFAECRKGHQWPVFSVPG